MYVPVDALEDALDRSKLEMPRLWRTSACLIGPA
jgi:hypothetical protein